MLPSIEPCLPLQKIKVLDKTEHPYKVLQPYSTFRLEFDTHADYIINSDTGKGILSDEIHGLSVLKYHYGLPYYTFKEKV